MDIFKKKYEIFGMVEKSCVFRMGTGSIRVDFRNGLITTAGIVPASFTTTDPVIQFAIENSDKFKLGDIKLGYSTLFKKGTTSTVAEANLNAANSNSGNESGSAKNSDKKDFPDVKNSQMAKDILMSEPYNVPLLELPNKTAIQAKAMELNITFSNWG